MTASEKAFNELIHISNSLEDVSYDTIKAIITDAIQQVPLCIARVKKGHFIDRARFNKDNILFNCENQVSYIKDQYAIDNYLNEFGRANKPHEAIFYGAMISSLIEQPRLTALWETSNLLQNEELINIEGELFTISRFDIIEEFKVLELVFSRDAIKNNPDVKRSFEFQLEFFKKNKPDLVEYSEKLLIFFSEQFSRKKKTHNDYKISCAYCELILDNYKLPDGSMLAGVTYPSVQSGLVGQNIALRPNFVDKYLRLSGVFTVKIHKNEKKVIINNHKQVTDFGIDNCNFVWEDTDPLSVRPFAEIEQELQKASD